MKISEQWGNIEVLDNIHIPIINKTYPVYEKTDTHLKLHDSSDLINGYWVMSKNFRYDVEIVK